MLKLISTDLVSRTKSIFHTLIGGVFPTFMGSGPPLHVPISNMRTEVCCD
jgi:hypothetical protein